MLFHLIFLTLAWLYLKKSFMQTVFHDITSLVWSASTSALWSFSKSGLIILPIVINSSKFPPHHQSYRSMPQSFRYILISRTYFSYFSDAKTQSSLILEYSNKSYCYDLYNRRLLLIWCEKQMPRSLTLCYFWLLKQLFSWTFERKNIPW